MKLLSILLNGLWRMISALGIAFAGEVITLGVSNRVVDSPLREIESWSILLASWGFAIIQLIYSKDVINIIKKEEKKDKWEQ
jgi:hypothetical protein